MQALMKEKRNINGDIVFVIDGSDGVDENSYRQTRNFVVEFIKYFTVGEKSARFGAILFGDESRKICGLSKFNNNKDIAKEIYLSQRINFSPDVNTHRALDLVIESEIFGIEAGGRSDAPDILILIGGGKSSEKEETLSAAKRLKSRGITIIAISVGGEGSKEFAGLSTSPSDFYSVSSFGELLTIIVKIIERTVKETLANEESYSSMVDLFFLMESGTSVGSSNHRKVLEFFSGLVKPFSVGDRGARVGALLYSDRAQKLFDLKTLGTKDSIVKTILNAPYLGGRANSYVAFNNLLSVFTIQSGGRLNAKRVVVFLTDEKTDKDSLTRKAALLVKNFGVIVLAIGVGDVEMTFLRSVASSSSDVFWVTGFDELASIRWAISHQIYYIVSECEEELHQKEIPEKQEIPKMPDTKVKLPPPVHPCRIKADVIFCLDSSGSIGPGNYQTMLQFAAELASNFPLGKDLAAIACVVFSNVANRRFDLGDYTSVSDVTEALLLTPYLESTTNTHLAFQLISNLDMFDSESGGRDDAAKIVIFMTDGQSTHPELTVEAAQRLQLQGVNIFSIGIGNYTLSELISVASDPRYVFTALDFKFLDKVKEKVAEKACEVPKEQKPTNFAKFASFNEEI
ncbi:collagen alpha-6(VI) chain-like [Physella acuta]|uniref:collagen alpha-6(VI) chain-like n=1 Tax=Physella acuta TaxID=109671 RepID=UPI0027DD4A68|nr:collagen alpha-6(VI) chain-like [Physella acuta]